MRQSWREASVGGTAVEGQRGLLSSYLYVIVYCLIRTWCCCCRCFVVITSLQGVADPDDEGRPPSLVTLSKEHTLLDAIEGPIYGSK